MQRVLENLKEMCCILPLHQFIGNSHLGSLYNVLYESKLRVLSYTQEHASTWSIEGVHGDIAAVEQALLAFVTEACPEEQDRDLHRSAACCLIKVARDSPADICQHACESSSNHQSKGYPPEVLHSFRALQPLLGPEGVADALTVLRALHYRMQHLQKSADGQQEARAPLVVLEAPEAQSLPPRNIERPLELEATGQLSSAGSCMARKAEPVRSKKFGAGTADNVSSGDTVQQQPPEDSQPSGKPKGDRQLESGTQDNEAEEAPAGAQARLSSNTSSRQSIVYVACALHLALNLKP